MSEGNGLDTLRSSQVIVETIVNESDRHRIKAFIRHDFDEHFSHIIIIARLEYGPVFLDCCGRIFKMDVMSGVLWRIGNSLEEATINPGLKKRHGLLKMMGILMN